MNTQSLASRALLTLTTLGWLPLAMAQGAIPVITRIGTLPTFQPQEYRGSNAWFDPAYNGQGWSFTELPAAPGGTNTGIGVSYTYETGGAPTWLLLQGTWQRETDVRRILEGHPIAVLTGPVFDGLGGACPTCPPASPSIAQRRYQNGEISFRRPDMATVKLDGVTALSGANTLVPAEFIVTRPLLATLVGTWRFTQRYFQNGNTYQEINYDVHGCQLTITRVDSPTVLNRFDADPASVPFWLPPSGPQVQWLRIDNGINCRGGSDQRAHIAYEPTGTSNIRGISLSGLIAVPSTEVLGAVASYTVRRTSTFNELYVQDPNTLIIRLIGNNNPTSLPLSSEYLLTRAP